MADDASPTEEELAAQLEEALGKLTVADILVQTALTLSSLGFRKLSPDDRDLAQAHLSIEALRAIVPLLGDAVPEQTARDLNQVIANLQLAYAQAARDGGG